MVWPEIAVTSSQNYIQDNTSTYQDSELIYITDIAYSNEKYFLHFLFTHLKFIRFSFIFIWSYCWKQNVHSKQVTVLNLQKTILNLTEYPLCWC